MRKAPCREAGLTRIKAGFTHDAQMKFNVDTHKLVLHLDPSPLDTGAYAIGWVFGIPYSMFKHQSDKRKLNYS